jgi:hypothetical protein
MTAQEKAENLKAAFAENDIQWPEIVWREWYNAAAVAKMTEMGTLPSYETDIDARFMSGDEVAAAIAEAAYRADSGCFRNGGVLVITSPPEFAGTYEVSVDYEPVFSASEVELD